MADDGGTAAQRRAAIADPEEAEDAGIFTADGAMHPEHPLLARAQAALKKQLQSEQLRLQEELREKQIMVNVRAALVGRGGGAWAGGTRRLRA